LASDPGDEDHSPPDPKPYYEEALASLNKAVELGATGFNMDSRRAGETVKSLNEIVARNSVQAEDEEKENRVRQVHEARIGRLPFFVRWPFTLLREN
jgi:hypothetical protein